MTTKPVKPGDTVYVVKLGRITNKVVFDIRPASAFLQDGGVRFSRQQTWATPFADLFDTRADAIASIIADAEENVQRAEKNLKNAISRLAKTRKKFEVTA